jgi:lysophospholipase L1-like esterase
MKSRVCLCIAAALGLALLSAARLAADPAAAPAAPSGLLLPPTSDGLPGAGPLHHEDWFTKLWNDKRTQWAADTAKDQHALVFLGDSITQGWGDVGSSFPGVKVANRGISGDTTRGVLTRLEGDVIAVNPRGVVLLIGTNDIELGAEPETVAANMTQIIAAVRKHDPAMPVVLCQVFPSSSTKSRPTEKIRKLNQLYREAVANDPQVTVLDTWSLFADVHGNAKEPEMPDLLHPDIVGYAMWANALTPVLETVGLIPAWPDAFRPEPGYRSLFNGTDLSGWHYEGEADLAGKTGTDDGRYGVRNGRLVVLTSHAGTHYLKLWSKEEFPRDFVLKLEFRASPNADSGIFVREPQLQCRDFIIAGPFATLKSYRPLDWNEITVTVRGGLAHCTCNGELLLDAMPVPATGPIGLESDRGQMEYRRIRIQEGP